MAAANTGGDENSLHSITYAALGATVLLAGLLVLPLAPETKDQPLPE